MTDSSPTSLVTKDEVAQLRRDLTKLTKLVSTLAGALERTDADVKFIAERVKPERYDFVLEYTELEKRLDARLHRAELKLDEVRRQTDAGKHHGTEDTASLSGDVLAIAVALRRRDWRVEVIEERLASVETRLGIEST